MTKLELINSALIHAGAETITSLDSAHSKAAKIALAQFDLSRQLLLTQYQWNFATTRVEIASEATAPLFEFQNTYTLPADFLRMSSIYKDFGVRYQIEGDKILTDLGTPLALVYIKDITDPEDWDAMFTDMVGLHIAGRVSFALTGNLNLTGALDNMFERSFARAKWADSTNNSSRRITAIQWLASRYGFESTNDRFHSFTATEEPFP